MKKQITERDKNRISFIFAFYLTIDFLNYIIGHLFGVGGMLISIGMLGVVMLFNYKTMLKVKIAPLAMGLGLVVSIYYVVTRQVSVTTLFGREFAYCFCFASVVAMYKADTEKFFRYLSFFSILPLFFYNDIFIEMTSTKHNTNISMGLSYSLFPMLLAPVFHFCFYRKLAKKYMYIIYVIAAFLLVNLIFKGNRGILVSCIFAMAIVFIRGDGNVKKSGYSIMRIVVVAILTSLVVVYFYEIVEWLEKVFDNWGIEANFVNKILSLKNKGDVSNGRKMAYEFVINGILEKPVLGHGISTTFYNSGYRYVYPHNMFLQLFYDGGVILAVPVIYVLGRALLYAFVGKDREEAMFCTFMFSICLPRLMFSADVWQSEIFWMFIMHALKYHEMKKKEKNEMDDMMYEAAILNLNNEEAEAEGEMI